LKKYYFLLAALFLSSFFALFSQENTSPNNENSQDARVFVLSDLAFDIKGRTRPYALIYNGEFKIGETFKGQEELEKYVRDKTQLLINQRVLKDNVSVEYSVGEQREDGFYPVILNIKVEDTLNFVALPRPAYSTNSGFEFTVKARDYNFLGTMSPLRLDLGYIRDEEKNNSFQFEVYSDIPFRALGYNWNIKFDNLFWYRRGAQEPFYYENVTGLSMELPVRSTTFTFGFNESFIYNEENSSTEKEIYKVDFESGLYMSSEMYVEWKIPTGIEVYRYGELTYTPGISAIFNHELPGKELLPFRKGPFLKLEQSLGFEKVDWIANFRDGASVFVENKYNYDFYRNKNELPALSSELAIRGAGFFILTDFFSITTQLQYRYWFRYDPQYYNEAADAIRGIADKSIKANHMLSLNLDFPFRVVVFNASKWLKKEKLKYIDFEMQISPVIDIALYNDPSSGTSFHPKNIVSGGGIEVFIFPLAFRSLYIRFGYTWNFNEFFRYGKFPGKNHREIYLLMRHFY